MQSHPIPKFMKINSNQTFVSKYVAKKKSSACGQEVICMPIPQERRAPHAFGHFYMTLLASPIFLSHSPNLHCIPQTKCARRELHVRTTALTWIFWREIYQLPASCISDQLYPAPVANMAAGSKTNSCETCNVLTAFHKTLLAARYM